MSCRLFTGAGTVEIVRLRAPGNHTRELPSIYGCGGRNPQIAPRVKTTQKFPFLVVFGLFQMIFTAGSVAVLPMAATMV